MKDTTDIQRGEVLPQLEGGFELAASLSNIEAVRVLDLWVASGKVKSYELIENNQFSPYDAIMEIYKKGGTGETYKALVEFKRRRMPHTKYAEYILEEEKLKRLKREMKVKECQAIYYLNTFEDNVALIWRVDRLYGGTQTNPGNVKSRLWRWCSQTACSDRVEVPKRVLLLEAVKAIKKQIKEQKK